MTTPTTITSQAFRDDATVQAKREARDYDVLVSPVFQFCGEAFRVVLDGHHSHAAARLDGVEPNWIEATLQQDDRLFHLESGRFEDFLNAVWHGEGDWTDIETGACVW